MPFSTADCKKFLAQIAPEHGLDAKEVWKRTRRYNGEHEGSPAILRDFEAASGALATIAECDGKLHLVSMGEAAWGECVFPEDHVITSDDVCQFVADCIKADPMIMARANFISGELSECEADELADLAQTQAHAEVASNWDASEVEEFPDGVPDDEQDGFGDSLDGFYGQESDLGSLRAVYTVFMPHYDTAYRYFVPVYEGNRMVLPTCDGD